MSSHVLPNILLNDFSKDTLLRLPPNFYKSLRSYISNQDIKKIQKAYTLAFYAHEGQERKDGSKYITHPIAVANILLEMKMDADSICAALMHDVLEDCDVNKKNLITLFGDDVAEIVDGVSKLSNLHITNRSERDANNLQKMMLAISKDIRVVLVKKIGRASCRERV